jgi:hypothetical protein
VTRARVFTRLFPVALALGCGSGTAEQEQPGLTGCASAPTAPVAPGGYYVNGNTICTADGRPHLFHGVDRPSLEWSSVGQGLSPSDFTLMASWHANVVRVALNQDFWLAQSPLFDPNYAALVDSAIAWAEAADMDVILDLHWSDKGVLGGCAPSAGCQQVMADVNSLAFWSEVAARYKDDGHVLFELYNEPHNLSWRLWRSGGETADGFEAVGMQALHDAVRATGAQNLVIVGGLDWAHDLSGVPANRIDGINILYAIHPYGDDGTPKLHEQWDERWGFLTSSDPVIATEFGDVGACTGAFDADLVRYADARAASWTAWGWFPGGCTFPALIDDWNGTPSAAGAVIKTALGGYEEASDGQRLSNTGGQR